MKAIQAIPGKIFTLPDLKQQVLRWRMLGRRIVFTNGVFDILHEGHIASLSEAASCGSQAGALVQSTRGWHAPSPAVARG